MTPAKHISISKAAGLLAFFTLFSRITGWLKDLSLASTFGASGFLDTFNTAFRIPDFLFNFLILGTLTVAFLPVFNRELTVQSEEEASKFASTIFTVSVLVMSALSAIIFFAIPVLLPLVAPGFVGEQKELAIQLTRFLLISPVVFTISNIAAVIAQSYHRFFSTALAPILYNGGFILGATVLYKIFGSAGLVGGVILGAFMHAGLNLLWLRKLPIRLRFNLNIKTQSVKEVWRLYIPRLFAFDTLQISLLAGSIFGSLLVAGSISVFNFAINIQAAPLGIFALSFAVAAFPRLSRMWAESNLDEFKNIILNTSLQILFYVIPISAWIFIMRAQVVRLLLGRGRFDWEDTFMTAQTLGVLILSLFAQSITPLLARAFYAAHNTLTPVVVSLISAATNIISAYFLSQYWGVLGIAAATTISAIVSFVLLAWLIKIKIGQVQSMAIAEKVLKILISATLSATAAYAALYAIAPLLNTRTTLGVFLQTGFAGLAGLFIYLITCLLMNIREARALADFLRLSLLRISRPLAIMLSSWNK